jgi:maltokinase
LEQWSAVHNSRLRQAYYRISGQALERERWFADRGTAAELLLKITAQFQASSSQPLYLTLNLYELGTTPGFFYFLPLLITTAPCPDRTAYFNRDGFYFYDAVPTDAYLALLGQMRQDYGVIKTFTGAGFFDLRELPDWEGLRFEPGGGTSNSILFLDGQYLFKNYRRIFPGVNPELRLGRALTAINSDAAPKLCGSFSYRPDHGPEYTLGLAQEFVAHQGTGWAIWERALQDPTPENRAFLTVEADSLGRVLAGLHRDLAVAAARADLMTAVFTDGEVRQRVAKLTAAVEGELAAIGGPNLSRGIRKKLDQISAGGAPGADWGRAFRIHGDLHLEQVLKTATGWRVIDFEGEPLKSIVEREAYDSPLKDLASLLRSVSYRVHTIAAPDDMESLLQTALLSGYHAGYRERQGDFLPEEENFRRLLELFQLERVVYELSYEAKYRPSWLHIPLQGLAKLTDGK